MQLRTALSALSLAASLLAASLLATAALAAPCAPPSAASPMDTVRGMYDAAAKGDRAGVVGVFAAGFYAFDGGRRYSGDEVARAADGVFAGHQGYAWTITEEDVHVGCDTAWATWVNQGTMTGQGGVHRVSSLESAVLTWGDGGWKLAFLQSARAPAAWAR